jgi:uncharacterized protein
MKNWSKLYTDVLECLQKKLSPLLVYHHWKHTQYVVEIAEYIAIQEHCTETEILLIKTAALFHDAGFINTLNEGHEEESIRIAEKMLPNYGYAQNEVVQVTDMIKATLIPQKPKNKLECIMADADLEYLGTDNFKYFGTKLFQELKHYNPKLTLKQWNDIQIDFLQSHFYHTNYCISNRTSVKEKNLKLLVQQKYADENRHDKH